MDPFFEKNLISTKEAGELSGYNADYLSRLARSGKINGRRVGRAWLVDRASLDRFLSGQEERKNELARSLARMRTQEYQAARSPLYRAREVLTRHLTSAQKSAQKITPTSSRLATRARPAHELRTHALALLVALLVVSSGAFAARAAFLPPLLARAARAASDAALGFHAALDDASAATALQLSGVGDVASTSAADAARVVAVATAPRAPAVLTLPDLSAYPLALAIMPSAPARGAVAPTPEPLAPADALAALRFAQAFIVAAPAELPRAALAAYFGAGERGYAAIRSVFSNYHAFIDTAGTSALAQGALLRDLLAQSPRAIAEMNLTLGNVVIASSRAAIGADIAIAQAPERLAPAAARSIVVLLGGAGWRLAAFSAAAPRALAGAYLDAVALPARAAPALAQAVFGAEYAAARVFVASTNRAARGYLASIKGVGGFAYEGAERTRSTLTLLPPPRALSAALEDYSLGALARVSIALSRAMESLRLPSSSASLAAALEAVPGLSVGERVALSTYQTVNGWFARASGALAELITPPTIVLPSVPMHKPIVAAPAAPSTRVIESHPTYTTVVRGVSRDDLQSSLALLRNDVLSQVGLIFGSIPTQITANNSTLARSIIFQAATPVNVVNSSDIQNSNFFNGKTVSSNSGQFTLLSSTGTTTLGATSVSGAFSASGAGSIGGDLSVGGALSVSGTTTLATTTLGATTIAGDLSVSGTFSPSLLNSGGAVSAPYFAATSSSATSTFAGSLAIGGNGFVYATSTKNVGIGVLSPAALLAIKNSTSTQPIFVASNAAGTEVYRITNAGFVGIGSSTPSYALSVEGSSSLGSEARAGFFTATSSAATSTFAGTLTVGSSTPFANALFAAGTTTSPFLFVHSTTGRIGIGTTTPAVKFDIFATDALRIPVGTSVQRPSVGDVGFVRYNTTTHQFEGFGDNSVWQGLGGVIDANQDTKITADTNNINEDTLRFFTRGTERLTIGPNGLIGVASTSPYAAFAIHLPASASTTIAFAIASSTASATSTLFQIDNTGNVNAYAAGATTTIAGGLSAAGTSGLTVLQNGSVGIGTASPDTLFQLGAGTHLSANFFPSAAIVDNSASASAGLGGNMAIINSTDTNKRLEFGLDTSLGPSARGAGWIQSFQGGFGSTYLLLNPIGGLVGIGTTTPATTLSIAGSGYLTGGLGVGLFNTTAGTLQTSGAASVGGAFSASGAATLSSTLAVAGNTTLAAASSTALFSSGALSALSGISVGNTATSTIVGDYGASSIRGALTVFGNTPAGSASSLALQRGSTNGDNALVFNDQTGATLLKLSTSANSGHAALSGFQSFLDLGTSFAGTALSIDTSSNVNVTSHLVPTANALYNLGSPAKYWNNGYINNIVANNLSSASTSIAGTNNTSFSIDSNNPTTDAQDISLIFFRGAGAPSNAVLSWNSLLKRFELNQNTRITNASASTASTTLSIAGVAGQTAPLTSWLDSTGVTLGTFTAGGLFSTTNASTTLLSVTSKAYFGGTATSTFDSAGNLALVANGLAVGTNQLVVSGGNVGIGTTSPATTLSVAGSGYLTGGLGVGVVNTAAGTFQTSGNAIVGGSLTVNGLCVTGDTKLRRRRRRKDGEEPDPEEGETADDDYIYDEVAIKDIQEGDEIQSLDEKTGTLVWRRVKKLAFMGKKQTYRLTTASGRSIRTTANHPYLARQGRSAVPHCAKLRTHAFIDASNLYYGTRENEYRIDFRKFARYLRTRYGVSRTFYYTGLNIQSIEQLGFYAQLEQYGYEVQYVMYKVFGNGDEKADVDARMATDLLAYADIYDRAVVITGDGDFFWTLQHLMRSGKEVKLFGYATRTARELKRLLGGKFVDFARLHGAISRVEETHAADAVKGSAAGSTRTSPLYSAVYELSMMLKRGVDKSEVREKQREVEKLVNALLYGFENEEDNAPRAGAEPVRASEGSWLKVAQLKEGMEIVIAGAAADGRAVWERIVSVEAVAEEEVWDIEIEGTHNFIGNGIVAHNTAFFNQASTTQLSTTQKAYFGGTATSTFDSAGALTLASALSVSSGGTGWAAIQAGSIPYGNGAGALATTTAGTAGNVLALLGGVPTWTATTTFSSGLAYAGGNVTNTGLLSLAQTYGTAQTGAITLATSTQPFNGLTLGSSITNTGGAFTLTPSFSGTLNNSGLTNSTIALALGASGADANVSGSPASLGGTLTLNLPTASAVNRGLLSSADFTAFNNKVSSTSLSASFPLAYDSGTGAFTFSGLSTSTAAVVGNIPYFSSANQFANVATSSLAFSSAFSGASSLGALVGGTASTLDLATNGVSLTKLAQIAANTILGNPTGATGNVQAFATSTLGIALGDTTGTLAVARGGTGQTSFTSGNLIYGAGSGALQNVATTSIALGTGLSYSGTLGSLVGGANGTLSLSGVSPSSIALTKGNFLVGNDAGTAQATSTIFISSTGSVGIGTTTPSVPLTFAQTTGDKIRLYDGGDQYGFGVYGNELRLFGGSGAATTFGTQINGVFTEKMRLTNTGNIGIGTTSPGQALTVSGNALGTGYAYFGGTGGTPANTTAGDLTATRLSVGNVTLGASGTSGDFVNIAGTMTETSGVPYAMNIRPTFTPANNSSAALRAINLQVNISSTTANFTMPIGPSGGGGGAFINRIIGEASITGLQGLNVVGAVAGGDATAAGNITDLAGISVQPLSSFTNVLTPTVTRAVGVRVVDSAPGTWTVTGGAGLMIGAISAATNNSAIVLGQTTIPTGNYGIYNASTNNNYFAGNVGIGTTSPGYLLDVSGGGASNVARLSTTGQFNTLDIVNYNTVGSLQNIIRLADGASYKWAIGNDQANGDALTFAANVTTLATGGAKMVITTSGNVGIGTTSPWRTFSVDSGGFSGNSVFVSSGNTNFQVESTNATGIPAISLKNTTSSWNVEVGRNAANSFDIFQGSVGARLTIDSSGNVGIGTTSPADNLEVTSTHNIKGITIGGAVDNPALNFAGTGTGSKNWWVGSTAGISGFGTGKLVFVDQTDLAATPVLTLTSSGNVGIGTTSPWRTLSVTGTAALDGLTVSTTGNFVCLNTTTKEIESGTTCTLSSQKVKNSIAALPSAAGLSDILRLQPVSFKYDAGFGDNGSSTKLGFIAEPTAAVNPLLAEYASADIPTPNGVIKAGDPNGINWNGIAAASVLAIQELNAGFTLASPGSGATSTLASQYAGTTTPAISVDTAGNVGIGMTDPKHTLQVAGEVGAIGFVNTSTRDAKTGITYLTSEEASSTLAKLVELKPATYLYKIEDAGDAPRLGFIAEDAAQVAPEILSADRKGVDLYKLATFTLTGVQELAARQALLGARVDSLEARIKKLEDGSITMASASPISFSTSTLTSALSDLGILVQKGIAQFNTLVFRQLVASKDADGTSSAGSVSLIAGNTVAQVSNSLVKPSTKIFITFGAPVVGSWWVSDKTNGSFRVVLSAPQAGDVSFDYFLVQTEGQLATSTPDGSFGGGAAGSAAASAASGGSSGSGSAPPVITMLGDNPVHVSVGGAYAEPGISIMDDRDGTIGTYKTFVNGVAFVGALSALDTSASTTYTITYQASDSAGNSATAARAVIIGGPGASTAPSSTAGASGAPAINGPADTMPPTVILNDAPVIMIGKGDRFVDPGATAIDAVDGDLTAKIIVSGSVNTAVAGLYTLTYSATDKAGNTGNVSRVVEVQNPNARLSSGATSTPTTADTTASTTTTAGTTASTTATAATSTAP